MMMNSLEEDLERALEDKKGTDVSFLVGYPGGGNIEKIQANKFLLGLRSPVLETQFSAPWTATALIKNEEASSASKKRKGPPPAATATTAEGDLQKQVIEIPDANPAAFRSFLKYNLDCDIPENLIGVVYLGRKYMIPRLVDKCLKSLGWKLNSRNVFGVLEVGMQDLYVNLTEIQQLCFSYIKRWGEELIETEQFLCISRKAMEAVVKLDNLGIEEAQLFTRIHKWGIAECGRKSLEPTNENIRSVLGAEVLYNIRFLSITESQDLGGIIWGPTGILTNEEQLKLLRRRTLGVGEVGHFNANPRCPKMNCTATRMLAATPRVEWPSAEMKKETNTNFCISHPAQLVGFGFFGSFSTINANYEIEVTVKNDRTDTVYAKLKTNFCCAAAGTIIKVLLEKPLLITHGVWYTIKYLIKGPPTFAGNGTLLSRRVIKGFLKDQTVDFVVQFNNTYHVGTIFKVFLDKPCLVTNGQASIIDFSIKGPLTLYASSRSVIKNFLKHLKDTFFVQFKNI